MESPIQLPATSLNRLAISTNSDNPQVECGNTFRTPPALSFPHAFPSLPRLPAVHCRQQLGCPARRPQPLHQPRLPLRPGTTRLPARGLGLAAPAFHAVGGRHSGRRHSGLPEDQLARRIRVRSRLGQRVCPSWPRLLPEMAGRGAVLAGHRPAAAGPSRSGARHVAVGIARSTADAGRVLGPYQLPHRVGRGAVRR